MKYNAACCVHPAAATFAPHEKVFRSNFENHQLAPTTGCNVSRFLKGTEKTRRLVQGRWKLDVGLHDLLPLMRRARVRNTDRHGHVPTPVGAWRWFTVPHELKGREAQAMTKCKAHVSEAVAVESPIARCKSFTETTLIAERARFRASDCGFRSRKRNGKPC